MDSHPNIYQPFPVFIARTLPQISEHRLFQLKLEDGGTWERFGHQPGQFIEVSIFGKGEAPISISSPLPGPMSLKYAYAGPAGSQAPCSSWERAPACMSAVRTDGGSRWIS